MSVVALISYLHFFRPSVRKLMSNVILCFIGYIQDVLKLFIVIYVTSLGALDVQESVIECTG
jgi:hypothetical protein